MNMNWYGMKNALLLELDIQINLIMMMKSNIRT